MGNVVIIGSFCGWFCWGQGRFQLWLLELGQCNPRSPGVWNRVDALHTLAKGCCRLQSGQAPLSKDHCLVHPAFLMVSVGHGISGSTVWLPDLSPSVSS